jgi:hypothetical protein
MSPLRRSAALDSRSLALVTFCNASFAEPLNRCALVDLKTEDLRIVDLDDWPGDLGATGMARLPNGDTIVASQGNRRLVRLSPKPAVVSDFYDDALEDTHSIAVDDRTVYVVATAHDSVLEYLIQPTTLELVAVHRLSEAGADTLHLNSVCVHEGRALVSMFGPDWRTSAEGELNGSIVDLKTRQVVTDSVRQPNSIVSAKGRLHVLGSLAGTVETVHDGRNRIKRASFRGYLRGLCFFPGGALVGVSTMRNRSEGPTTDADEKCGIAWFDRYWLLVKFIDLSWLGQEIYDLAPASRTAVAPTPEDTEAARVRAGTSAS